MLARLNYWAIVRILRLTGIYHSRNRRYAELISRLVRSDTEEGHVLVDVGCGPGILTSMLPSSYRILGVDMSREFLTSLSQDKVEKIQARAERLPMRTGGIDLVLAISLIEHLRDHGEFLGEVHRILRLGGLAILQVPEIGYPLEPHTKWPFLQIWNTALQGKILSATGYDDLNLSTSINGVLDSARSIGLLPERVLPIWPLRSAKLFGIPLGYFVLLRKPKREGKPLGE